MKVIDIAFITLMFFILSAQIAYFGFKNEKQINHSKEHQERFDALVRDSVKMHKIYENWQLNYQELKKLEE